MRSKLTRLFVYSFYGAEPSARFDAGLVNPDGSPLEAFSIFAKNARAPLVGQVESRGTDTPTPIAPDPSSRGNHDQGNQRLSPTASTTTSRNCPAIAGSSWPMWWPAAAGPAATDSVRPHRWTRCGRPPCSSTASPTPSPRRGTDDRHRQRLPVDRRRGRRVMTTGPKCRVYSVDAGGADAGVLVARGRLAEDRTGQREGQPAASQAAPGARPGDGGRHQGAAVIDAATRRRAAPRSVRCRRRAARATPEVGRHAAS